MDKKQMVIFKEDGITLIEIMLGITLLVMVIVPMLSFIGNGSRIIKEVAVRQKALNLAQQKMEELKSLDFTALEFEEGESDINYSTHPELGIEGYPALKRTVNISDDPLITDMKVIKVIISWDNDRHDITLITRRTKGE